MLAVRNSEGEPDSGPGSNHLIPARDLCRSRKQSVNQDALSFSNCIYAAAFGDEPTLQQIQRSQRKPSLNGPLARPRWVSDMREPHERYRVLTTYAPQASDGNSTSAT
jgi:hypothetical protein